MENSWYFLNVIAGVRQYKEEVSQQIVKLELELEFNAKKDKEYKIEAIKDIAVCTKAVENQLPELYYLVSWNTT